jgi:chromatin segregation and condensation protein Rec8/ScpA/Scc1 (kleisin family)
MTAYEVCIDAFEGPMDLLLYLVQKSELNPRDISIAEITDQFLDYVKDIHAANLSTAGDFLYMASRLMLLKVRELLPREQQDELEPIEFDADKEALIRQILEYEKFKAISDAMRIKEEESYGCFVRGRSESFRKEENKEDLSEENIGLYHLYKSFLECMKVQSGDSYHTIEIDDVLIEDRQQYIENYLHSKGKALFEDLIGHDQRLLNKVVTFIAILEMVKTDNIIVRQVETAGAMWIYRKKSNTEFVDEMMNDINIYTPDSSFKSGLADYLKKKAQEAPKEFGIDTVLREITQRISDGVAIDDDELERLLGEESSHHMDEINREAKISNVTEDFEANTDDTVDNAADEMLVNQTEETVETKGQKMHSSTNMAIEFEDDEDVVDSQEVNSDSNENFENESFFDDEGVEEEDFS